MSEIILRKNAGTPIYAKKLFGTETFFQMRRSAPDPAGSAGWPFDKALSQFPERVRSHLAPEQNLHYI